jgi:hypothetical protein
LIARLHNDPRVAAPVGEANEFRNDGDVEREREFLVLTHRSCLGLPASWVRTKEHMTPVEIDKAATAAGRGPAPPVDRRPRRNAVDL